jgi:hypothetical protein
LEIGGIPDSRQIGEEVLLYQRGVNTRNDLERSHIRGATTGQKLGKGGEIVRTGDSIDLDSDSRMA